MPLATVVHAADPGVEFGAEDDLTVLGVQGGGADPDVEIKGFTVFGTTQTAYPGGVPGPGNVVVNGILSVSSGAYFASESTFTVISVSSITTTGAGVIFSTNAYFMNGNVGIGTAAPVRKLDVAGEVQFYSAGAVSAGLYFGLNPANGIAAIVSRDQNIVTNQLQLQGTSISLNTAEGTSRLFMNSAGNVGVGTAVPGYKLDVAGTGRFTDTIMADWRIAQTAAPATQPNPVLDLARNSPASVEGPNDPVARIFNTNAAADQATLVINNAGSGYSLVVGGGGTGYTNANGVWIDATGKGLIVNSGNVGVGTTVPTSRLTVGTALTGTALSTTVATNFGYLGSVAANEAALASIGFLSPAGNNVSLGIRGYRAATGADWTTTAIGLGMDVDNTVRAGANLWLHANGNVGIGTTGPDGMLHIRGGTGANAVLQTWGAAGGAGSLTTAQLIKTSDAGGDWIFRSWLAGTTGGTKVHFAKYDATPLNGAKVTFDLDTGNVGIGTTAPAWPLVVNGGTYNGYLAIGANMVNPGTSLDRGVLINSEVAGENTWIVYKENGVDKWMTGRERGTNYFTLARAGQAEGYPYYMVVSTSGNVGIGTTAPVTKLQINSAVGTADRILRLVHDSSGLSAARDRVGNLEFVGYPASDALVYAKIAWHHNAYYNYGTDLSFWTAQASDNVLRERVRITESGNVGIGTTGPGEKLEVAGAAKAEVFKTTSGNVTVPNNTPQNVYTLPAAAGTELFIVTTCVPGVDNPNANSAYAFIMVNGSIAKIMTQVNGVNSFITVNTGTRVISVNQNNGSQFGMNWAITRLNN